MPEENFIIIVAIAKRISIEFHVTTYLLQNRF